MQGLLKRRRSLRIDRSTKGLRFETIGRVFEESRSIQGEKTTDDDAELVEDKATPAWRQFELDVVTTIKNLDPHAEVHHDQRSVGVFSGVERQLDATAGKKVADAQIDLIIECKQYKNKLGIGKIDEFVGKLIDVGCSHGILYATNGVTEPARRRAEASRNPSITLRDLSDIVRVAERSAQTLKDLEGFFNSNAVDFSEIVEEAVFGNCTVENCHFGEVNFQKIDGITAGHCDSCGQFHVQCSCCDEIVEIYSFSSSECFTCGARYGVFSYQGDIDGLEQEGHGVDCDREHNEPSLSRK